MRFRAIGTRTREQVGEEFDAPDWGAAKVIGAMRETVDTRVVIQEVHPAKALLNFMDSIEETTSEFIEQDKERAEEKDLPLQEVERKLDYWLRYTISGVNTKLPAGFHLAAHVHRSPGASIEGRWPVSFTLVQDEEENVPENGNVL